MMNQQLKLLSFVFTREFVEVLAIPHFDYNAMDESDFLSVVYVLKSNRKATFKGFIDEEGTVLFLQFYSVHKLN